MNTYPATDWSKVVPVTDGFVITPRGTELPDPDIKQASPSIETPAEAAVHPLGSLAFGGIKECEIPTTSTPRFW